MPQNKKASTINQVTIKAFLEETGEMSDFFGADLEYNYSFPFSK